MKLALSTLALLALPLSVYAQPYPSKPIELAGIPKDAAVLLEQTVAKVHKSAGWRDFMAKNLYEDVYMSAEEFGRHLAARQIDMNRFLSDSGLLQKKQ